MPSIKKKLLIVCAFRSGSKHISNVLRRVKVKVGHESVKEAGCVSGYFVGYGSEYGKKSPHDFQPLHHEGEIPNRYSFEHIWHMTRDPLKSIGSGRDVLTRPVMAWAEYTLGVPVMERGGNKLHWAAQYWLATNIAAESIAQWRFKVEDVPKLFPEICDRLGIERRECPDVSKTMGRSYRTMKRFKPTQEIYDSITYPTIDEIKAIDMKLGKAIERKIKEYGYA